MQVICGHNTSPLHRHFFLNFFHVYSLFIFDMFRHLEEVNKLLFLYTGQGMPNNSPRMMGNNKFAKVA